ncbi:MAG: T9SS type A sorting domain-containing protein [Flavobacteriaceae bacterium]|nr:T9SS type A sorting domain-containing protein [Flavobacteriaceae bacterium]
MKKITLILTLFITSYLQAQIVNIPDANFKNYLIANTAINTNGDIEIQVSEATAFTGTIDVNSLSISDLTGIEAFTALTILACQNNSFSTLDVSQNTALTELRCQNNSLSTLDVTQNTALTILWCDSNSLSTLDVSQNTALTILACGNNSLITLDVSQNTALTILWSHNNSLTSLNVANGNNTNITNANFWATNNPSLTCIEVDDVTYSDNNWTNIDATASFSTNCSLSVGEFGLKNISIYPNPTKNEFIITGLQEDSLLEIYGLTGQLVLKQVNYNGENVDVSNLSSSVYFAKLSNKNGTSVKRLIIE